MVPRQLVVYSMIVEGGGCCMQILGKLVSNRLHRLYVVDEMTRPIGIVTLTDILRTVMQQSR